MWQSTCCKNVQCCEKELVLNNKKKSNFSFNIRIDFVFSVSLQRKSTTFGESHHQSSSPATRTQQLAELTPFSLLSDKDPTRNSIEDIIFHDLLFICRQLSIDWFLLYRRMCRKRPVWFDHGSPANKDNCRNGLCYWGHVTRDSNRDLTNSVRNRCEM